MTSVTHLCALLHLQSICLAVGGSGPGWISPGAKPWSFSLQPSMQHSCCHLEGGADVVL